MSCSEEALVLKGRSRISGRAAFGALGLAAVFAALSGCTVQPLYARHATSAAGHSSDIADIAGRISVAAANDRTAQVFRNAIVTDLSGKGPVVAPLYELRFTATGNETVVAIQQGSGIPSASLYEMSVTYSVLRLADTKVVTSGTRFATAPFDRTRQLYAASRALLDARDRAGQAVAAEVELAILAALRKDIAAGPPPARAAAAKP